jgi:cell surface protein SprA
MMVLMQKNNKSGKLFFPAFSFLTKVIRQGYFVVPFLLFISLWASKPQYLPLPEQSTPLQGILPKGGILEPGNRSYLNLPSRTLTTSHNIDFANRSVTISQFQNNYLTKDKNLIWASYYPEIALYTMDMYEAGLQKLWLNSLIGLSSDAGSDGEKNVFDLDIPVNMPIWMRDFGLDKPKLKLSGQMDIRLLGRGEYITGAGTYKKSLWPSPSLDYNPSFIVEGQIGRNITVSVNNSEGGLGVRNQLKVVYAEADSGEFEDYILQRVEAGHTNLELPGTELTGYSENHQGLFGIKSQWKIGDLWLTAIASQEGGSQESYSLRASERETEFQVRDKDFLPYRYYFLTLKMREDFIKDAIEGAGLISKSVPQGLNIYRVVTSGYNSTAGGNILEGITAKYQDENNNWVTLDAKFRVEEVNKSEWEWDARNRVVRLQSGRRSDIYLARWGDGPLGGDGLAGSNLTAGGEAILFKPQGDAQGELAKLMLRTVYNVGVSEETKSSFRLGMKNKNGKAGDYLVTLGVADSVTRTVDPDMPYFNKTRGELWLPCRPTSWYQQFPNSGKSARDLAKERCLEPLRNLDDRAVDKLYTASPENLRRSTSYETQFYFEAVGKKRSSSLSVKDQSSYSVSSGGCIDIAPGTEKLTSGSETLVKDVDYQVNYELGQIELISDRALDPNKEINVDYECEPLFDINNKLLLGARAEYPLRSLGQGSLIGATALYKKQSVGQEQPQFGGEPFSSSLLGANVRLTDTATWMSRFINSWPLIKTNATSRWTVEGELAFSYHDPNTSKRKTALLDDFESSRLSLQYSLLRTSWYQASPPGGVDSILNPNNPLSYKNMGEFIWHSNLNERYRNIYGSTGNPDVDNRLVTLLKFTLRPNDNLQGRSWGGVMRGNSSYYHDMTQFRYIEVVARGRVGELFIDLGAVSEDISINGEAPNGVQDTEAEPGTRIQLHDMGLDGVTGADEHRLIWDCRSLECVHDTLRTDPANTDLAGDDFEEQYGASDPSAKINGTEGNKNERIDDEDIDGSGYLDTEERFIRYRITLNEDPDNNIYAHPNLEVEDLRLGSGWKRYRIPLTAFDSIAASMGSTPEDILIDSRFTRFWYGNVKSSEGQVQIADFRIVGSRWDEGDDADDYALKTDAINQQVNVNGQVIDVVSPGRVVSSDSNYLRVRVINNQENVQEYYKSPNTITEIDQDNGTSLREQALVLEFGNLHPGQEVKATRLLEGEQKDLSLYELLKMEIHLQSRDELDGRLRFAIRLGTGTDQYYEWSLQPRSSYCGTDARCHEENWRSNALVLKLEDWPALKNGLSPPYLEAGPAIPNTDSAQARNELIRMVGSPSLGRITTMQLVVIAGDDMPPGASGSFWINDLRVSGVQAKWGQAARSRVQMDFADVMTISANMRYQDGDFATLRNNGTRSPLPTRAEAKTQLESQAGLSFNLDKFFKDEYQIRLPLGLNYSNTVHRPYIRPSSDQILTEDNFSDLAPEFFRNDLRVNSAKEEAALRGLPDSSGTIEYSQPQSKGYQTWSESKGFSLSYSKQYVKNEHIAAEVASQFLLERPQVNFSYRQSESRSALRADSTYTWDTEIGYNLGQLSKRSYRPFKGLTADNFYANQFKRMDFSPWPQTLDFRLIDFTYSRNKVQDRDIDFVEPQVLPITTFTADLSHSVNMNWTIFNWLSTSYNLQIMRDMNFKKDRQAFTWENLSRSDTLGGLFGLGLIADHDHWDREVVYDTLESRRDSIGWVPVYDDDGNEIPYIPGVDSTYEVLYDEFVSYVVERVGARAYGKDYGILRNERNRTQNMNINFNPVLLPFMSTQFTFSSNFTQNRTMPERYDPWNPEYRNLTYYSVTQGDKFSFRPTLRLQTLLSPIEPAEAFLKKWNWRDIRFNWEVDLLTAGEDFTLSQLYNEQGVMPADYWLYSLGLGTGRGGRSLYNVMTGDMDLKRRSDFTNFNQYRTPNYDTEVYQGMFRHAVQRRAGSGTNFTLPWWRIGVTADAFWDQRFEQSREYPLQIDTTIIWPKWSVGINLPNFANKIKIIDTYFSTLTSNHRIEYSHTHTNRSFQPNDDEWIVNWSLMPLIRLNGTLKNKIRLSNSVNYSWEKRTYRPKEQVIDWPSWPYEPQEQELAPQDYDTTAYYLDEPWVHTSIVEEYSYSWGDDFSLEYDLKASRGFQIYKWYIRLENDINLKMTSGYKFTKTKRYDLPIVFGYDPLVQNGFSDSTKIIRYITLQADEVGVCPQNTAGSNQCAVYAPLFDYTLERWTTPQRRQEFFIKPQAGYSFNKNVESHAWIEYRFVQDRFSSNETRDQHLLMFEIGLLLRFD